jgi:hypothetical protein
MVSFAIVTAGNSVAAMSRHVFGFPSFAYNEILLEQCLIDLSFTNLEFPVDFIHLATYHLPLVFYMGTLVYYQQIGHCSSRISL